MKKEPLRRRDLEPEPQFFEEFQRTMRQLASLVFHISARLFTLYKISLSAKLYEGNEL